MSSGGGMGAGEYAQIAGGIMSASAALFEKQAMQQAYADELRRQRAYRDQALGVFNRQLPQQGAGQAGDLMRTAAANRLGKYANVGAQNSSFQSPVATERDLAYGSMFGGKRANLEAYQDWQFGQKMRNIDTGRDIDRITNFAGGTSRVFPYRMYEAQHSLDDLTAIGNFLSSSGSYDFSQMNQGTPTMTGSGGGYGAGLYYPRGTAYGGSSNMPAFTDSYGNTYPRGWNQLGGQYEGQYIPG